MGSIWAALLTGSQHAMAAVSRQAHLVLAHLSSFSCNAMPPAQHPLAREPVLASFRRDPAIVTAVTIARDKSHIPLVTSFLS